MRWLGMVAGAGLVAGMAFGAEVEARHDLSYGPDPLQKADLYDLRERPEELRPALVWIHGGGWTEGDKRLPPNGVGRFAESLVREGYVVLSCNYRLGPAATHPAQVNDVQRVIRWIRSQAGSWRVDPDRIGVFGISAGGHLAALVAVKPDHAPSGDELDRYSSRVQAAVALNAPLDFSDTPELMSPVLRAALPNLLGQGRAEAAIHLRQAEPIRWAGSRAAPLLLVAGAEDTWVPPLHSKKMADALKSAGAVAEVQILPGKGHGIFPDQSPEVRKAVLIWFGRHLKRRP